MHIHKQSALGAIPCQWLSECLWYPYKHQLVCIHVHVFREHQWFIVADTPIFLSHPWLARNLLKLGRFWIFALQLTGGFVAVEIRLYITHFCWHCRWHKLNVLLWCWQRQATLRRRRVLEIWNLPSLGRCWYASMLRKIAGTAKLNLTN